MTHGHQDSLQKKNEALRFELEQARQRIRLLEQENEAFAGRLRELGEPVRQPSHLEVALPAALRGPVPEWRAAEGELAAGDRHLFAALCAPDKVRLIVSSENKVDVGLWFWKRRLWVCVTDAELILFAAGPGQKSFVQRVPLVSLYESMYNAVTGELVLAPDRKFKVNGVRVSPVDGLQILAQIVEAATQSKQEEGRNNA